MNITKHQKKTNTGPYGGSSLASVYDEKAAKAKKGKTNLPSASSVVDMVSLTGDAPVDETGDENTQLATSADGRAIWHCRTPPERPTLTFVALPNILCVLQ